MDADAKRLAALKEELRKDMEALERVERLMASKNGSLNRPDDRQLVLPVSGRNATHNDIDSAEEDADDASRPLDHPGGVRSGAILAPSAYRVDLNEVDRIGPLGPVNPSALRNCAS